ncbi:MAG: cytochrome c3 family protein [Nitrospirae bacterium]|nr:cytochrome c3 family protein [Nitrospirota bacterium]
MHNSQDGDAVGSGPNAYLMTALNGKTDPCIGCHFASNGATWKDPATNAPIVWNGSEPSYNAQKGLAGGNFYWVGAGNSTKGHNVYGIAAQDANLNTAPGENTAGCGGTACHVTLAAAPSDQNFFQGGCRGCHVFTYHHEDNGVYRFLKGHGVGPYPPVTQPLPAARKNITTYADYVTGVEDPGLDWEQETTTNHNWYKGTTASYSGSGTALRDYKSITAFCAGCHRQFHGPYEEINGSGMGSASPWMRHPTDIALPDTGEYGSYDPDVTYNAQAPVAWTNPSSPTRAGAVVMCLSCHRPHGSDQADLLRWSYSDMQAGTTDPAKAGKGCFVCHTQKDGL